jgi:hypothetical protein
MFLAGKGHDSFFYPAVDVRFQARRPSWFARAWAAVRWE